MQAAMNTHSASTGQPELKRSGPYWVVSVSSGREEEAMALFATSSAEGFVFNSVAGAGQSSIDKVLAESRPSRIVVANMPTLDFAAIYACGSIRELVLGYGCPWPDFTRLSQLTHFSAMEACPALHELPLGLIGLGLYGYQGKDLEALAFLQYLKHLDMRMSPRLAGLSGIGQAMADLSLAGAPRLQEIDALKDHQGLARLYLSKCSKLRSAEEIFSLQNLRELTLDKVPVALDLARIDAMGLDFYYVNGRRGGGYES